MPRYSLQEAITVLSNSIALSDRNIKTLAADIDTLIRNQDVLVERIESLENDQLRDSEA